LSIAAILTGWCLVTFGLAWWSGAWVPVWSVSLGVLALLYGVPAFVAEVRAARAAKVDSP
jgi:uncharacterized membrane protein